MVSFLFLFLFTCLPGLSLLVSALFRWPCHVATKHFYSFVSQVRHCWCHVAFLIHLSFRSVTGGVRPCPLAMKHFYSFVSQVRYCWCPPFSVGHVAFLIICLPGLSLLVSALFPQAMQHFYSFISQVCHCWCPPFCVGHAAFLFISLPNLSVLVSALFRWRCNISIHLFSRSVTAGVRPFPLAMQHFYSFVSRVCHWCCRPFPLAM